MLRFCYIDSPPPLSVGLFFIHNHPDGTYSGEPKPVQSAFTATAGNNTWVLKLDVHLICETSVREGFTGHEALLS